MTEEPEAPEQAHGQHGDGGNDNPFATQSRRDPETTEESFHWFLNPSA